MENPNCFGIDLARLPVLTGLAAHLININGRQLLFTLFFILMHFTSHLLSPNYPAKSCMPMFEFVEFDRKPRFRCCYHNGFISDSFSATTACRRGVCCSR